jgi:hypothetical protein
VRCGTTGEGADNHQEGDGQGGLDAIAPFRVGDDRVKKATAQQRGRKFDLAMFDDDETVEDYALRMSGMAVHLTTLDEEVKDDEIVAKML